jgi:biotin carboxylase
MKRILLLLPTSTYRTSAYMEAASRLGLDIVVGTEISQSLAHLAPKRNLKVNIFRPDKAVTQIMAFHEKYPLDAIAGVDEDTVLISAMAREKIGLPFNPIEGMRAVRNKFLFRQAIANSGLTSPDFRLSDLNELKYGIGDMHYPVVLKPLLLSGGRGVVRVDSDENLRSVVTMLEKILSDRKIQIRSAEYHKKILVESYIDGEEVAVEGLLIDGKFHLFAIFDKPDPLTGPYFAETIYATPSLHSVETQKQIITTVTATAEHLGLRHGPVHAELRFNSDVCFIVELANRPIGGLCSRILRFENNQTLEQVVLRHAAGLALDQIAREEKASGVMMIPIPRGGIFKGVRGVEAAKKVDQIEDVVITIPPGDKICPLPWSSRYLGFIFARGDDPAKITEAIRQSFAKLTIDID